MKPVSWNHLMESSPSSGEYPHFTDEYSEFQRQYVIHPQQTSGKMLELVF